MKTIGLIGGMSWESTVTYYQLINEAVKKSLGGLHSAKILLYSVDFQEIEECQTRGDWEKSARILGDAAKGLEGAGADCIVICTNTMHKVAPQIGERVSIPILHIAEATAEALIESGISRVLLLGTHYTMQQDFYKEKLGELCLGVISEESRKEYLRIIEEQKGRGAQGVILGCTEIGLLISQADTELPVFDTTQIHAGRAAEWAVE